MNLWEDCPQTADGWRRKSKGEKEKTKGTDRKGKWREKRNEGKKINGGKKEMEKYRRKKEKERRETDSFIVILGNQQSNYEVPCRGDFISSFIEMLKRFIEML